jgi:hypothetical protein
VDKSKGSEQRVSARRRLIRGAFAAPAALTLFSGSAFAQTSMTCVSKQVADPVAPSASGSEDEFLRVPLYGLGYGGNVSTWIKVADLMLLAKVSEEGGLVRISIKSELMSPGGWLCVSNGKGAQKGSWTVGNTYLDPKLPNVGGPQELRPPQFVAVRVDGNGTILGIVGVGPDAGSGSAVGWDSCWASFTGVARFN